MKNSNKSLKSNIGIFIIALAFVSPLIGLIIPMFNLDSVTTTTLVAFFLVGGPEIFIIAGIALAGKEGLTIVKNFFKKLLGLPQREYFATKSQYYLGLSLLGLGILSQIIIGYLPFFSPNSGLIENVLVINLVSDMLIVLSFFISGSQFITKFKELFSWRQWEAVKK